MKIHEVTFLCFASLVIGALISGLTTNRLTTREWERDCVAHGVGRYVQNGHVKFEFIKIP